MAKAAHRPQYASTARLEKFLNQAFETTDSRQVCLALGAAVRAQENVAEFARRIQIGRTRLYRSFMGDRSPEFTTVLTILGAFGLQLRVKRVCKPKAPLDPYSIGRLGKSAEIMLAEQLPVQFPATVKPE